MVFVLHLTLSLFCNGMVGRTKLKLLYMYAAGFYTYSIFALIFWETRRSDFGVTMSHHVATVILILASYLLRFITGSSFMITAL